VQLRRMRLDTLVGMAVSNVVAFCIMLTGASVLHVHGITDIDSAAQAAKALEPVAGRWSFVLFALGIIGTGMLAIPTLAGSTAYAVAETFKWPRGLNKHLFQASGFYAIIAIGTLLGVLLNAFEFNPMTALYWSAVINGVVAVPLMVIIMLLSSSATVMGRFTVSTKLKWGGWLATIVMGLAAFAMIASWFHHGSS
jgi:Mn2+/Fe2+ NRAMP family transporter